MRLGIPALFHFFRKQGYDVWVYSANYYSMEYIRRLFRHYNIRVTGIVTGTGRKAAADPEKRAQLEKQFKELYIVPLHADKNTLVWVDNAAKTFREYPLHEGAQWSAEIMNIIREIADNEKKNALG